MHKIFKNHKPYSAPVLLLLILFAIIVLRNAWISDDAYITFRTIENFLHGYGLSYNVGERVQVYTHPLWMFIIAFLYYGVLSIFGDFTFGGLYYVTLFASFFFSMGAVVILSSKIARTTRSAILGLLILLFSKAFIDFTTSGLENPLSYFLLSLYLLTYFKEGDNPDKKLFQLSLIASLGTLNRLDTFLLFIPGILWIYFKSPGKRKNAGILMLGFIPLIIWEIFSLIYYGFPFPNTAYAKLYTSIPQALLLKQGLYYLINSLNWDIVTLLAIGFSVGMIFIKRDWKHLPLLTGIFMYLLYTIKIGGGFMSGRFLSMPLFFSVAILTQYRYRRIEPYIQILFILILAGFSSSRSPILSDETYGQDVPLANKLDNRGISDERAFYYPSTGFFTSSRGVNFPASKWINGFWSVNENKRSVIIANAAGITGYELGPNTYIIDVNAIVDPLLARLPVKSYCTWSVGRIGHFKRAIPIGYQQTIESDSNQISNPDLHKYYDKLTILTQGDIFSWERIAEIWNFNTGEYNYLLQEYLSQPETRSATFSENCPLP
ncbi:MAG: hypothetical protein N2C13_06530 [Chloroflexota bacterium]